MSEVKEKTSAMFNSCNFRANFELVFKKSTCCMAVSFSKVGINRNIKLLWIAPNSVITVEYLISEVTITLMFFL